MATQIITDPATIDLALDLAEAGVLVPVETVTVDVVVEVAVLDVDTALALMDAMIEAE